MMPVTSGILSEEHGKENLHLLSGQRRALESVATGVAHAWPCLIIGNPASGKNSIVRVLAQLCCRTLTEIALTQGTDTSDLLGGFEQMEIPRMIKEVFCEVVQQSLWLYKGFYREKTVCLVDTKGLQEAAELGDRCSCGITNSHR